MNSRKKIVLIAIVVGAFVLLGGIPMLNLLEVTPNTNGEGFYFRGVRGGSNANGGGDLLDTTAYVTSWTGGGTSEKLVVAGHYYCSGGFDPDFPRYWYVVKFTVNNPEILVNGVKTTEFTSRNYEDPITTTGKWLPMESIVLTITNPAYGTVRAELWGHIHYFDPLPKEKDVILATDEGYLRSGIGSVKVQNDVVEEGQTANFYVETGYSHSAKSDVPITDEGWFLNVYNPSGTNVYSKTVSDDFSGTIGWKVPTGSYSPTSDNIYKVVLRNELLNQDDDWFFTIGVGMTKDIPGLPSFKITSGGPTYHPGDQITVEVSSTKTTNTITGFWVWVSYETSAGTTTHYIYEKKWYAANPTTTGATATVTFTFPDTGNARLEVSAVDTANLNSGISEMKFTVYGTTDTTPPLPTDWTTIAIVAGLLIMAVLLYFMAPVPKMYKLIIVIGLVAVAVYFAWPLIGG